MARLGKNKLLETAVRALRAAGWQVRQLSPPNSFPTRLLMEKDGTQVPVCLYIWNLTHGGGSKRPKNEYRIQVTSGVHSFENQPGSVTLILGWGARFGVFAAFDVHCRSARLGSSPSIQIAQETLSKAGQTGAAVQDKGNGEFAIAVRPDRLATYVAHHTDAHAGDISSLVVYSDKEIEVTQPDNLEANGKLGSEEEMAQRHTILERLEALEREMQRLRPAKRDRAHNRPPELLPANEAELVDQIATRIDETRGTLRDALPNLRTVSQSRHFFEWLGRALQAVKSEAVRTGRTVREKAREHAAELLIGSLAGGATIWHHIAEIATAIADAIANWIQMLF